MEARTFKLPSLPPPAPIQLLWTPHGIMSCNGQPVELYYPPNMSVCLPPAPAPPQSIAHNERQVDFALNVTSSEEEHRPQPASQPGLVHDKALSRDAMREDHALHIGMELKHLPLHAQQEEPPPRQVPRDDLSDSLHSLSFEEQAPADDANPTHRYEHSPLAPYPVDSVEDHSDATAEPASAAHQDTLACIQSHMSQQGVMNLQSTATPRVQMGGSREGGSLESADPFSGAEQRPKLDYGRRRSSPESPDLHELQQHNIEGGEEQDDPARSVEVIELLPSRLVRLRPRSSVESRRSSSQDGALSAPPRASRAPNAPRKMAAKRSQAPAAHAPISRPRKPPAHLRLRTPDRRGQESVQLLEKAPSPPLTDTDTDTPLLADSTFRQQLKTEEAKASDAQETADYGSEDELLLKPDDVITEAPNAMATEVMSSMGGLGGRQMGGGQGRVVSIAVGGSWSER